MRFCFPSHKTRFRQLLLLVLLFVFVLAVSGCRITKPEAAHQPVKASSLADRSSVFYLRACVQMALAKTRAQFEKARQILDQEKDLDLSKETPDPLIIALDNGIRLMEVLECQMIEQAAKGRLAQKQLKEQIKGLQEEVDSLKHQISVLENIEQERLEKRKNQ